MSEIKKSVIKSEVATLDVGIDWSTIVGGSDTILTSVWESEGNALQITRQQVVGNITSCYISGGVTGSAYRLYNTITTDVSDIIDRRYILVKIQDTQV